MKPIRSTASMSTNIAAKNNKVGHSTLAKIESISFLSVMMSRRITPIRALHLKEINHLKTNLTKILLLKFHPNDKR